MDIHLMTVICWLAASVFAPLDGWLLYRFGWSWSDLGIVEGYVPGVVLLPSPYMVEQPWNQTPRYCLLWCPGSMISTSIAETPFLFLMILFFDPPNWDAEYWYCYHVGIILVYSHCLFKSWWWGFFNLI